MKGSALASVYSDETWLLLRIVIAVPRRWSAGRTSLEPIIMKLERYPVPYSSTLIDAVMDGYVAWREESAAVQTAYGRWLRTDPGEQGLAFAAYLAALDREERAAETYQRLIGIADRVAASQAA